LPRAGRGGGSRRACADAQAHDARSLGRGGARQVAMPPEHCVWADQQLEPAQCGAGQRHEQGHVQRSVFRQEAGSMADLPLQDGELVAQR
jgi:hypothetical protein